MSGAIVSKADEPTNMVDDMETMAQAYQLKSAESTLTREGPGGEEVLKTPAQMPQLFGSGGHQDGVNAMMQTNKNRQKEDSLTMNAMGDRTVDEVMFYRNISNANTEFNYSQYKTGAYPEGTDEDPGQEYRFSNDVEFEYLTTNGVAGGDVTLEVDPQGDEFETVAAAMGVIGGNIWSEKGDGAYNGEASTEPVGNPFADKDMTNPIDGQSEESRYTGRDDMKTVDEEDDEGDPTGVSWAQKQRLNTRYDKFNRDESDMLNRISATGLRRVNIKKNQSDQLQNVATRQSITNAMDALNEAQSKEMQSLTQEQRKLVKSRFRYPGSKYATNQIGLMQASNTMYKKRQAKNMQGYNGKLSALPVGT